MFNKPQIKHLSYIDWISLNLSSAFDLLNGSLVMMDEHSIKIFIAREEMSVKLQNWHTLYILLLTGRGETN